MNLDPVAVATQATGAASGGGGLGAIGMIGLLTLVTLLPAIVLSCTCFVRFVVVFGFVRTGIGTPSAPPNQVLVGLALFMAVFVSAPVAIEMYEKGGQGYLAGTMTEVQAIEAATPPLREFLLRRTVDTDLELFYGVSGEARPQSIDDVPLRIAIPAFILGELRTAFEIGLTILLPFLVIDLIAAAVLTSLGMVMVPPQVVALPVKLLVFVMIDGWYLVVQSLLRGAGGMSVDTILDLWRGALSVIVEVSAPFLLACLAVGLAVAILQTATQLQESVLTFVPKLGAALVVIALAGHWCLDRLGKFTTESFTAHAENLRGDRTRMP